MRRPDYNDCLSAVLAGLLLLGIALLVWGLAGCSTVAGSRRVDPPLYFETSPIAAEMGARLHAFDVGGMPLRVKDTHSMEPLLMGGDFVVVAIRPYAELESGRVVSYRADWAEGQIVTHRTVQKDAAGWIMSGDHNPRSEPQSRMTERNYIGEVVARWRVAPDQPRGKIRTTIFTHER
jgi:hypothetical protein